MFKQTIFQNLSTQLLVEAIKNKYSLKEVELLYDKADELIHMLTDQELFEVAWEYTNILNACSNLSKDNLKLEDIEVILESIEIFEFKLLNRQYKLKYVII